MTVLWIALGLAAAGITIVFGAAVAEQLGRAWGIRRGHRDYLREERRANHGPPPGMPDRRRRNDGPAGRHRREGTPGEHTATGILRAVRATDSELPPIPRATRAQLRDSHR